MDAIRHLQAEDLYRECVTHLQLFACMQAMSIREFQHFCVRAKKRIYSTKFRKSRNLCLSKIVVPSLVHGGDYKLQET